MNTEHRQQKISFWHSMKTQFIAVVILVAAVIVILYTLMIMPGVKSNIRSIYSNYLLDLSISYGREMESAMQVNIDLLDNRKLPGICKWPSAQAVCLWLTRFFDHSQLHGFRDGGASCSVAQFFSSFVSGGE